MTVMIVNFVKIHKPLKCKHYHFRFNHLLSEPGTKSLPHTQQRWDLNLPCVQQYWLPNNSITHYCYSGYQNTKCNLADCRLEAVSLRFLLSSQFCKVCSQVTAVFHSIVQVLSDFQNGDVKFLIKGTCSQLYPATLFLNNIFPLGFWFFVVCMCSS